VELSGENRLKCEDGVLRDGKKGSFFYHLPQVLLLHLQRFVWDWETDSRVKLCDKMEFPARISPEQVETILKAGRPDDDVLTTELSEYFLHAVLVHIGGAQGGHYLSYIRVDERWYEFNDADIKEVAEEVVLNTCGCDESVGAVKRMKAGTAYMLVYSREAAKGLRDVKVPEMMKERIDLANRKLREARLADEEKKNVVFCTLRGKVRDLDIDRKVQLSKKMTVRSMSATIAQDILSDAREMFDSKENLQHNVRLRQWDSFALVPHRHIPWTFDDSDNFAEKTLMDLMNGDAHLEFFLEEKPENSHFPPVFISLASVTVRVCKFDQTRQDFSSSVFLTANKQSSCLQLAGDIETFVALTRDSQEWLVVADDDVLQIFPTSQGNKTLQDMKIVHGTTIYLAQTEGQQGSSQYKHIVEEMFFKIPVKIQWQDQNGSSQQSTFSLDLRWTVQAAKKEMSKLIEKDDFHLLLPGGKALEDEEKKFKELNMLQGECIHIVDGTCKSSDQIRFEVVQMSLSDCSLAAKGVVEISRSEPVSSLTSQVAKLLGLTTLVCMRRELGGSLSSILLDDSSMEHLPTHNRLIVHDEEEGLNQERAPDQVLVYARRLKTDQEDEECASKKTWKGSLSRCRHIAVNKSWTIQQAAAKLKEVFSLSCSPNDISIIRVPWGTPMDSLSVAKLPWRASEGQLLEMAAQVSESVRDGSFLLFRVSSEWLPVYSQQDAKERGVSITKLNQPPPPPPPPPPM